MGETDVLARVVMRAPSVHNIQPWRLELPDGEALLFERTDLSLPYHDPRGRDRVISCGAAVVNLDIALRVLSLCADVRLLPEGDGGGQHPVARFVVAGTRRPEEADLRRYSAIERRRSYRWPFAAEVLSAAEVTRLIGPGGEDVHVRQLSGRSELEALADLLEYAGVVLAKDHGYQREMAIWAVREERTHTYGAGVPGGALPASSLPWAGLVEAGTALPDRQTLVKRLEQETVLMFATGTDGRGAHLRTGMAMQRVWLAAVEHGLVAAVQTHPLHLDQARRRFGRRLALTGYPQVLMRVGRPSGTVPRSLRHRAAELLLPRD